MNILVVDDSAFMRKVITDIVERQADLHVADTARDGKQAVELIDQNNYDLVLMDIEMPVMNGLEALKIIRRTNDVPVIILSALSKKENTIEALATGATDFVEKPKKLMNLENEWVEEFVTKVRGIDGEVRSNSGNKANLFVSAKKAEKDFSTLKAIVIGASTGGPKTLLKIIGSLNTPTRVPILIVQHMPKGFTTSFAERLNQESKSEVIEAKDGMKIESKIYVAPGNFHMVVRNGKISLNQGPKQNGTRPAVDNLFISAADIYKNRLAGIILTGMGKDGTIGMSRIKDFGGYTFSQDEASSVIFGMPRSAIEAGVVDEILSLDEVCQRLQQMIG
ncbi:protein-glutamate methylesterase/protein-glutamine glutaminase [Liquorilactobacillus mali]|uniref:protein-glutamate methylesterase/protein-glutamine glutaminase n=1 Tax=Liquorilactobacillus mali TaxID=1618 RepID=UPI002350F306|nr:chemotaxis response regulator protein-glutamate methylesterase [Liquorilactobacillus mali]MDC7953952.1 chemotaxis response regulator protein-glutamate methylesterase [Liquorilactobacillus mali]